MEVDFDKLTYRQAVSSDGDCPSDEEMKQMVDEIKATCDELKDKIDSIIQKIDDALESEEI